MALRRGQRTPHPHRPPQGEVRPADMCDVRATHTHTSHEGRVVQVVHYSPFISCGLSGMVCVASTLLERVLAPSGFSPATRGFSPATQACDAHRGDRRRLPKLAGATHGDPRRAGKQFSTHPCPLSHAHCSSQCVTPPLSSMHHTPNPNPPHPTPPHPTPALICPPDLPP